MRFRRPGREQQDLFGLLKHAKELAEQITPLDHLNAFIDLEVFRAPPMEHWALSILLAP